ncbi:hypothetical protein HAX54_004532 [Datura stramonium]|uniref:RNase H type-1 domain-containing protein n=1 Tax=Datura stramonium TaxID=4076 RepID=A0ABS8T7U6_DATST|nr:hypothetical protein [Datura stramonium]
MGLDDTFDQDDINKYYKNNMEADSKQAQQKIAVQMAQYRMMDMENSQQQVYSISGKNCDPTPSLTVNTEVQTGRDASLQKEKKIASVGVAGIDRYGNSLQAFENPIQFVGKTFTDEALAIREALKNAMENGWSKVQILSDAKTVVDMIYKKNDVLWEIEATCEDIWTLMGSLMK